MANQMFQQHAAACGLIDDTTEAVEIADCIGHVLAYSVLDPETMNDLLPMGIGLTPADQGLLLSRGLDYVVCFKRAYALH